MTDDTTAYPQPPQPTVVPGTGSAVQTATDPEGNKWQFDNEGGNWVNLTTGEAVSPKIFSQMAGRSGNTARDTMALAEAMRREEATLSPPSQRSRSAPPPFQPTKLSEALLPPNMRTTPIAPTDSPLTGTAPVLPPGGTAVRPPSQFYSPEQVERVAGQRPVPSTRLPPTDAAMTFYKQQQIQRLVDQGWKPADALKMIGIGQAPSIKPIHVGDALVNPTTGQPIYTAPPRAMTEAQKAANAAVQERLKMAREKAQAAPSLEQKSKIDVIKGQIKSLQTAYASAPDDATREQLNQQLQAAMMALETAARPAAAQTAVTKPSAVPRGTSRQEIPMVGEVVKGYRFKGGDPSKKQSWEKVP